MTKPRKTTGERRRLSLSIALNRKEFEALFGAANRLGLSVAAWARARLLEYVRNEKTS